MDQEERRRKVEAGRAKLAYFRQCKAKGDGTNPQKKTQKRKGVRTVSSEPAAEEHAVVPEMSSMGSGTPTEDTLKSDVDSVGMTAQEVQWPEAWKEGMLGDSMAADACEVVEDLTEMLVVHAGKEPLQELQLAVQKRNDIISQLSANLQVALQSRHQVQLEALQLSEQIRALQQQLQQASEYLLSHSHSCAEISQAHEHVSQVQHSLQGHATQLDGLHQQLKEAHEKTREQQKVLTEKQGTMTDFQNAEAALFELHTSLSLELGDHKQTPSDDLSIQLLVQRLSSELENERENSQQERDRASRFETLARALENERNELKEQLACVQADLNQTEMLTTEVHQYKAEKEQLNLEMVRLKSLVQDLQNQLQQEEQTGRDFRAQFESDRSNFEFRLQALEEEKEMDLAQLSEAHEIALQRLQEEHKEKVEQLSEQLEILQNHRQYTRLSDMEDPAKSFDSIDCEDHGIKDISGHKDPLSEFSFSSANHLMEKYLASAIQQDCSGVEESLGEIGNLVQVELDSELDIGKSTSSAQGPTEDEEDLTEGQDLAFGPKEGSLSSSQWPTCESFTNGVEEAGAVELGKALLIQECSDLAEQLKEKEKQLEVLQEEVERSREEVQEAVQKWSCVTETLQSIQKELEAERAQRLRCEEIIRRKTHEEDNLRNRLSSLQNEVVSLPRGLGDLLQEMKQEKEHLLEQLREQEQLVWDVQEQKLARDSLTCDVQLVLDRQLSSLQMQRDQLQVQLEAQREKHWTGSELLAQKMLELDSSKEELQHIQAELLKSEGKLEKMNKENADLQSRLVCLQQNLASAEEAVRQGAVEKADRECRLSELEAAAKNMESIMALQQEELQKQLLAKNSDVESLDVEKLEVVDWEKVCALEKELSDLRSSMKFQEQEHREAVELLQKESEKLHKVMEKAEAQLRSHQEEIHHLEQKHQEEVQVLHLETQRKLSEVKGIMEEEQKKQIVLIKQVHEREHLREQAELASRHQEELAHLRVEFSAELQNSLEAAHQAELLQVQAQQALELEALRLSLSEQHAAQLELSQHNLQRDKEAALIELQTSLRDRWAQESAMLQARQQRELERVREQHQQELEDLKEAYERRLSQQRVLMEEQQASALKAQRAALQQEADEARAELQASLADAQAKLEDLLASKNQVVQQLKEDLNQAWTDRDAAARAAEELNSTHNAVLHERQEHVSYLEEQLKRGAENEQQLQQQVEKLQAEYLELKSSSEQEVSQLWSQLGNMRASRQELGELKDQLLARSSCVEDIERIKQEFSQQRKDIQEHNELELQNLRSYFERRLQATEESYREEIALLQLRLVEGALEESVLKTGDASFISEGSEEKNDLLAAVTAKLEKHKEDLETLRLQLEGCHKQDLEQLRDSLASAYGEELLQVKADLANCYFQEIQGMKSKHALEMEQLRAKLSECHVKEITRLRLQSAQDVARQVEAELKGKVLAKDHEAHVAQVHSEAIHHQALESKLTAVAEEHDGEVSTSLVEKQTHLKVTQRHEVLKKSKEHGVPIMEELQKEYSEWKQECPIQNNLDGKNAPQVANQEMKAQFHSELQTGENMMADDVKELNILLQEQMAEKLCDAQDRFQEEQKSIKKKLAQQHEEMKALKVELEKMEAELKSKHKAEMEQLEVELKNEHKSEMEKLEVELNDKHRIALEHLQELHKKERDELEARMLSNMDTLEATYLSEIQSIRDEHTRVLQEKERSCAAELQRLSEEQQSHMQATSEELRGQLAQAHMEKFTAMAAELGQVHKEQLLTVLSTQRQALEEEHEGALMALRKEVFSLEEQQSFALQELRQLHQAEVEALQDKQQQRLQELSSASAHELETLRRELEGACQHRQAIQKELESLRRQYDEQASQGCCDSSWEQQVSKMHVQLQEQEAELSQLRVEMSQMKGELEGKRSEMATLEGLLQRRERENQEGSNLVAMLRADLNSAAEDKRSLQDAHERLLKTLVDIMRTTLATEDLINRQIGTCLDKGVSTDLSEKAELEGRDLAPDSSLWSTLTDEGMELSHRLSESLLHGLDLEPEGESVVLSMCERLRSAVGKLLELLSESTKQLQDTRGVQAELQEQFTQGRDNTAQLVLQQQQLLEQLDLEASVKSQLELELHKAEGLMEGYVAEKAALEEAVQQKENLEQRLVEELDVLRVQLQEISEERTMLIRQRDAVAGSLTDVEKALLEEVQHLAQEKLDVQRQAEKDRSSLVSRLKLLESELEQQESQSHELEERLRARSEDFQQQIHALEKQLKHKRQFIDEQAVEREHERDEFQQEIKKLEAQLRQPNKGHSAADGDMQRVMCDCHTLIPQVESLQTAIKEKVEDYNALLLTKERFERDITEQNEEIDRMSGRIRELEQALLSSAESNRALAQLEQELQRARKVEQDLLQDREALQQQQYSNRIHISALQSKLDETRHRLPESSCDPVLREQLESMKQDLLDKQKQACGGSGGGTAFAKPVQVLLEQLDVVQSKLGVKEEEVSQLNLQLDLITKQNSTCVSQLQSEITSLKEQLSSLQKFQDLTRDEDRAVSSLQLPLALLEEKNLEIDHLNQQVVQLQQELNVFKDSKVEQQKQVELEHLRSQVELLRSDQQRLRQDRDEEAEQLHEVINKLQEELARLGPDRLEVSDPLEHSSQPSDCWPPAGFEDSLGRELQSRLDQAHRETEALQEVLHNQKQSFSSQLEEMGQRLGEKQQWLERIQEEAAILRTQMSQQQVQVEQLSARLQELEDERDKALMLRGRAEEELKENSAAIEAVMVELQESHSQIRNLEKLKEELSAEVHVLRQSKAWLQEEVERLKQELTSNGAHIKQLIRQLEEQAAERVEAHKEVLTCADETLAKAEGALQEKEQQLNQLRAEHTALKAELASVKEGLSSSTERAEKLVEESQTKDRALAELEVLNQHLKLELRGLQEDLALQEQELCSQRQELDQLREQHGLQAQQDIQSFRTSLSHEASGESPECLRHLDFSVNQTAHLSELSALHCTSLELLSKDQSLTPAILPSSMDPPSVCSPGSTPSSTIAPDHLSVTDCMDADKVKELEDMDLTPPISPTCSASSPSPLDWASDGYGSNMSSELGAQLQVELDVAEHLDAHFVNYLRQRGMAPTDSVDSPAGSKELMSPELQGLLKKLYQEAGNILALSQSPAASAVPPSWQREKRALQEAVLSLRELLCKVADHKPQMDKKETDRHADLLQALRSVFASERDSLRAELQSIISSHATHDPDFLMEQLTQLLEQQEGHQQQFLEKLLSAERRSLLAELHDLQGQLRIASLKSQEQLQQLQACVSTAQEESGQQQHQLRRQVELLEFQLEQEQMLMKDLRSSLAVEQGTVSRLSKELEESSLQLCTVTTSQQELHNEICRLRMRLESEEMEHMTQKEELKQEKERVQELQQKVNREQAWVRELQEKLQKEEQSCRLQQEEQQHDHKVLRQALEQERVTTSNLRRELQIEQSRCEALIIQEKQRTSDVTQQLEETLSQCAQLKDTLAKEKREYEVKLEEVLSHSTQLRDVLTQDKQELTLKLQEALSHSTRLTDALALEKQKHEELMKKLDEAQYQNKASLQDQKLIQELTSQLEQERHQGEELAAMLNCQQQEALHNKQKLEQELHTVQEQLHIVREKEAQKELRETRTWQEKVLELDQQHQQDQVQIHQLQQSLADLQQSHPQRAPSSLHSQHQLKITQQQLQLAMARVKEVLYTAGPARRLTRGSSRQVHMEEDLQLLLHTMSDLEQDLKALVQASPSSAALEQLSTENTELHNHITALGQDKAALKHSLSCLQRELQAQKEVQQHSAQAASSSSRCAVLRQQHPGALFNSPLTREHGPMQRDVSSLVPSINSPLGLQSRLHPSLFLQPPEQPQPAPQDPEHSLSEYIQHLEAVQQRLGAIQKVHSSHVGDPKSGVHGHVMHATDLLGYHQKWLLGNRTRLYLSRLSPLYRCVPGSPSAVAFLVSPRRTDC
ncbi:pericentrin isoform X6 [Arapaima gigas]